jgi:serine/threonine protein kinase
LCPKQDAASLRYPAPLVKVADFGMAAFVGVDGHVRGRCGTPGYVAPEIFSAGLHGGYSNKVDVFSTGVTLYVMLCGYEPFYGQTEAELVAANKKAENVEFPEEDWAQVSPEAIDLVKRMMDPNPITRFNAKQALQHPWFAKMSRSVVKVEGHTQIEQLTQQLKMNHDNLSESRISGASCPPSENLRGEGVCTIS